MVGVWEKQLEKNIHSSFWLHHKITIRLASIRGGYICISMQLLMKSSINRLSTGLSLNMVIKQIDTGRQMRIAVSLPLTGGENSAQHTNSFIGSHMKLWCQEEGKMNVWNWLPDKYLGRIYFSQKGINISSELPSGCKPKGFNEMLHCLV